MATAVTSPLDPRRIDAEIARIRERESGAWSAGTKATLFNLVIVRGGSRNGSAGPTGADPVEEALGFLLGKRPARILAITTETRGPADAVVSARCHPDQRGRGVCFEEIDVAGGEGGVGADPGAWSPLLVRDIPTFLWWTAPPAALAIAAAAAHADKLIVDCGSHPQAARQSLAALRERAPSLAVADLSWSRIRPLRVQVARAFDPPETRELIGSIAAVELAGGTSAEALLFFLWLGARLGWLAGGFEPSGVPRFRNADGHELSLDHRTPAPLAAGVELHFRFRDAAPLDLRCTRGGCLLRGAERGVWRVASDGELLLAEVDSLEQDALLLEALDVAARSQAASQAAAGKQPLARAP